MYTHGWQFDYCQILLFDKALIARRHVYKENRFGRKGNSKLAKLMLTAKRYWLN
jgi:hypothetical protein